jgi:hypothetical protein
VSGFYPAAREGKLYITRGDMAQLLRARKVRGAA